MTLTILHVQDVFYLVAALCFVWITIFLCWALYEIGKLGKQTNEIVSDTRHKIDTVEQAAVSLVEKLTSLSSYLGIFSTWGKEAMGLLQAKSGGGGKKGKKKVLSDMIED